MRIVEIDAKDHYEAGFTLGQLTAKLQHRFLDAFVPPDDWNVLIRKSQPFLNATKKVFPQYIDEINGLANGSGIPFEKIWVFHCLDEITQKEYVEKCSSVFIRQEEGAGYIVGHNEDWDEWTRDFYFLLRRTLDNKTVLELGMAGNICAGTVSVNSGGMVQAINSLYHTDYQVGIPKQIVARWLSSRETLHVVREEFPKLKRAAGYAYNLSQDGRILAIESSATRFEFYEAKKNYYVHTNNYIGILEEVEEEFMKNDSPSAARYKYIKSVVPGLKTVQDVKDLLLLKREDKASVYRTADTPTVASLVFDVPNKKGYVTQENKGAQTRWEEISLDFITEPLHI